MKSKEQLMQLISKASEEKYQYLKEFFKYMPNIIAEEFHYVEVKKNEKILLAGELCKTVYIILEGDVEAVDYFKTGSAYSFLDFSEMIILGDFELFSNRTEYMVSLYAQKDCKLLMVPADRYLSWVQHDENALYLRLQNVLSVLTPERRWDRETLRMDCKERVITYLAKYYEKYAKETKERVKVELTQSELSQKVGCNIRSVQRALASLEEAGYIALESRKMVLSYEHYLKLLEILE